MANVIQFAAQLDDQVSKKLTGIRSGFENIGSSKGFQAVAMGVGMAAGQMAFGALAQAASGAIGFIQGSVSAASDLNETLTKAQTIFGPASRKIEEWAETMDTSFGQSQRAALDTASTFAGLFETVGMAANESADMAVRMTELGSDLASFFNTDVASAVGAIRSGLAGESEPLRKFNVFLSETAVSAKAAEMGLKAVGGKLTEAQKITARYQIILDQTSTAQGDFARTSDGLANQQRIQQAQMENLSASIGQKLLPVVLELTTGINSLLEVGTELIELSNGASAGQMYWNQTLRDAEFVLLDIAGAFPPMAAAAKAMRDDLVASFAASEAKIHELAGVTEVWSAETQQWLEQSATGYDSFSETAGIRLAELAAETASAAGKAGDSLKGLAGTVEEVKVDILADARALATGIKKELTIGADWDTVVTDWKDLLDMLGAEFENPDQTAKYRKWADTLTAILEKPMTGEDRIALLQGAANLTNDIGLQIADGLASGDPKTREGAKRMLASVNLLLQELKLESYDYAYSTGEFYANGLRKARAVVKAGAIYMVSGAKEVLRAFSPPGPESPLHEIDVWGENTGHAFGKGMADGIMSAMPLVTAALDQLTAKVSATMLTLEQITEATLGLINSAPTGLSSRGWGKMSPAEQDLGYFQALVNSGAYQWDIGPGGGYRVSPTGTSSADTLVPGAPPPPAGAPVVVKLTLDGREIAEYVDRNLFYRMKLGTTG